MARIEFNTAIEEAEVVSEGDEAENRPENA